VKQEALINTYINLLKEANTTTNLYSKHAYEHLDFHIQDALNLAEIINNKNLSVIDIGSGSGFPAIIIAIANPNCLVFAVESKKKKCHFLNNVKKHLGLNNLSIINADIRSYLRTLDKYPDFYTAKAFKSYPEVLHIIKNKVSSSTKLLIPISPLQAKALNLPDNKLIIKSEHMYIYHTF
jgi:16S rRNA (guanine527-N7)-methyltransferase